MIPALLLQPTKYFTPEKCGDENKMTKHYKIVNGAYHEAGHAVVAYQLGWWVRYIEIEGVGEGSKDYTGLSSYEYDRTYWRRVSINCAGWLSGWKNDKKGLRLQPDNHLEYILEDLKAAPLEEEEQAADDYDSLIAIRTEYPNWKDEQVIQEFRQMEEGCWEMLADPTVWRQINGVASLLLSKGKITREEAEAVLESN